MYIKMLKDDLIKDLLKQRDHIQQRVNKYTEQHLKAIEKYNNYGRFKKWLFDRPEKCMVQVWLEADIKDIDNKIKKLKKLRDCHIWQKL